MPGKRRTMLLGGWRDVGRLFAIAAGFDILFQIAVLRFFYPVQASLSLPFWRSCHISRFVAS